MKSLSSSCGPTPCSSVIEQVWLRCSGHVTDRRLLFQLHGTMRVVLEPLLGDMPLVGALSVFFLKKPVSTLTSDLTP